MTESKSGTDDASSSSDATISSSTTEEHPLGTVIGGARWVLAGRVVKIFLKFVVQILVARILGTTSFGGLSLARSVSSVGSIVGGLGIGQGVQRNAPFYEDDEAAYRGTVQAALVIGALGGASTALAIGVAAPWIASRVFNDPNITILLRIAALGIPVGIVGSISVSVATGARDASTHTIVRQVVGPITGSLLIAGLVILGYGAVGAIVGNVLNNVLTAALALVLMRRVMPFSILGATKAMYRTLLGFSLPLVFAAGMNFVVGSADTLLLGYFRPSADVGIYNAAFTLRTMPLFFFFPATFLLAPVLTRLQREDRSDEARQTYQAISKWTTLFSIPLFLLGFLFPEIVMQTAFGMEYVGGAEAFRIIMASAFGTLILGANARAIVGLGHNKASMWTTAIAGILNVILNIIWIPPFGIVGAALASLIAFVSRNILNSVLLYKWHGLSPISTGLIRVIGVSGVLVPVGYYGFVTLFEVTVVSVIVVGLLALPVYLVMVIRLGATESVDLELLKQIEATQDVELGTVRKIVKQIRKS